MGSLIAPYVVLTAAHCGPGGSEFVGETVRVGAMRLDGNDNAQEAKVVEQIVHPSYNDANVENDLMILVLDDGVQIQGSVILDVSNDVFDLQEGTTLTTLGLGVTDYNSETMPEQLMDVEVGAFSDQACVDAYGTGPDGVNLSNMFCAGVATGGKDACSGDSGGPIVRHVGGNVHKQVGVVSWGVDCASPDFPGVYSRIPGNDAGFGWIKETTCEYLDAPAPFCDNTNPNPIPNPSPTEAPVTNPPGCPSGQMMVEFEIDTDDCGDETTWDIYDSDGNFYMGDTDYAGSGTHYYSQCLPSNLCYTLNVHDSHEDGIYSAGYELKVDGELVSTGDGDFQHSISHPFNCDNVENGGCVPVVLDFFADDVGEDNEVYMMNFDTGNMIFDAVGFDPYSVEQFDACIDPSQCVMLYVVYGDFVELFYDGNYIFNNHVQGVGEIFSFGCDESMF